ncbi:MAG: SDR family NAD(P)-dependent oxidoreductase [Mucilaginibacter sp.]|uniref:SDR family NAD(P)-dependent oxidoreductase n=1 Tax=Mucilaginibacter sp. TaxID=1882438 RepID=UPI0032642302
MPKKTIIITGATSGIGEQTALALARNGDDLFLLVRNIAKGERVKRYILVHTRNPNIYLIECDMSSLASVKKATEQIRASIDCINILVNNAGSIFPKRELSKDGFEMTFALNHLSHFLLTLNLMPLLQKGKARIVNVSSAAHKAAKPNLDDIQIEKGYKSVKAYADAKLFNIYFTQSLAQKYAAAGITAYSLHPGLVNTQFGAAYKGIFKLLLQGMRRFMITAEQGAETSVYVATEPGLEKMNGSYFKKKKVAKTAHIANNVNIREQLWDKSNELVKPFLVRTAL